MDTMFLELVNQAIAASWLMMAVLLARLLLKKAPKWVRGILWGMVAVRLICPFSLQSVWSLVPSAQTFDPFIVRYAQTPSISSGVSVVDRVLNPMIGQAFAAPPTNSANPLYIWMWAASIVWVIGVLLLLGYALIGYILLHSRVREAVLLREDIWIGDAVSSPFLLGLLHPRIYLPSGMQAEWTDYVLAHERAHMQRKDHWWKPLGYILLSVYWFHPLLWVCYALFCRDIELACDEKVTRDWTMAQKKAYSSALLACSMKRTMVLACPLFFGEVEVKARIKAVLHDKKPTVWVGVAGIAACLVVGLCFLTNPPSTLALDFSQATCATLVSGKSGELVTVTDAPLQLLCADIEKQSFVPMGAYDNVTKWQYRITWYDAAGNSVQDMCILSDNQIEYNNTMYQTSVGQMDVSLMEYLVAEERHTVLATIVEISEQSVLVEPMEGSVERASANRFAIDKKHMPASPVPNVGDVLQIQYHGQVLETYPAMLGQIDQIDVLKDEGEPIKYAIIPMVMVEDSYYYDTGRPSAVANREGAPKGTILSTVDGSQIPQQNNQSNFGAGYVYRYGEPNTIEVHIDGRWIVFEHRAGDGSQVRYGDKWYHEQDIMTLVGTIVDHTIEGKQPLIVVKPIQELPYAYIAFVLPEDQADWMNRVNTQVEITCTNTFTPSQPPFGELLAIRAADGQNISHSQAN